VEKRTGFARPRRPIFRESYCIDYPLTAARFNHASRLSCAREGNHIRFIRSRQETRDSPGCRHACVCYYRLSDFPRVDSRPSPSASADFYAEASSFCTNSSIFRGRPRRITWPCISYYFGPDEKSRESTGVVVVVMVGWGMGGEIAAAISLRTGPNRASSRLIARWKFHGAVTIP